MDEEQRFTRLYDAIKRKEPVDEIISLAIDQHMLSARKWVQWVQWVQWTHSVSVRISFNLVKTENEIKHERKSHERLNTDSIEFAVKYFSTFLSWREHPQAVP